MRTGYQLFIGGKWRDAISGKTFKSINPATGEVIAEVAEGDARDIDLAVAAARRAFEDGLWRKMDPTERGRCLRNVADLLRRNAEEFAVLDTKDCGKPITDTRRMDVPTAVALFDFYAGMADKIRGSTIPMGETAMAYTVREPMGVVGLIVPWNYPLMLAAVKTAPALACGNAVILKPASNTSLSALELGRLCQEAGIPDGIVNVVSGQGAVAGEALVCHPDVDKISFTGSTEAGKRIMRLSAGSVKRLTLELGGKSPNIVFPDADMNIAVEGALFGMFLNQGQDCCANSRLFLHEAIYDEFMSRLLARTKALRVGDPMDERTQLGSLVSTSQQDSVEAYVTIGRQEGASLETGGRKPDDPSLAKGCFYLPTVFSGVKDRMRIAQEEIFGPVLCVFRFKDEDEVVQRANDVAYGLAASIWTRDLARGHRVAGGLRAGMIWLNTSNYTTPSTPFGGYKQTGFGRELGVEAVETYTQLKDIWVDLSGKPIPWFA